MQFCCWNQSPCSPSQPPASCERSIYPAPDHSAKQLVSPLCSWRFGSNKSPDRPVQTPQHQQISALCQADFDLKAMLHQSHLLPQEVETILSTLLQEHIRLFLHKSSPRKLQTLRAMSDRLHTMETWNSLHLHLEDPLILQFLVVHFRWRP